MSAGDDESTLQELVIIRRRTSDEEGGHHGGVWKIAYADFMTAMMAFFLVMWLINATDKKVLTQVATYFNPLRLTDRAPTPRGLHDADTGAPGDENVPGDGKAKSGISKGGRLSPVQQKLVEDALFNDPYGTLEVLAQQAAGATVQQRLQEAPTRAAAPAHQPGAAFRDPFDPDVRPGPIRDATAETARGTPSDSVGGPAPAGKLVAAPAPDGAGQAAQARGAGTAPVAEGNAAGAADRDAKAAAAAPQEKASSEQAPGKDAAQEPRADAVASAAGDAAQSPGRSERSAPATRPEPAKDVTPEILQQAAKEAAARADLARLDADIRQALGPLGQGASPEIEVTVTDEGLLISLTDKYDFGMFAIASAEPRPATVHIMEKIAKVLHDRPGQLIVRGHTDGRPFRSASYDNWRLSTARAHMAYYMLIRGGLDEKRFERIEGYADHALRVPSDPEAAQNRRIELLLRRPKP